ncbi:MAG TPA: hypothetical protein VGA70_13250 [Longimicrobiales bacterium]|jgi:hypothetical protein
MSERTVRVRLVLVDDGSFHEQDILLGEEELARHERLIDCLREEMSVLRRLHVDLDRLSAAFVIDEEPSPAGT